MNKIIEYIILVLTNALDFYIVYRFMTIFLGNYIVEKKMVVLAYFLRFSLSFFANLFLPYPTFNLAVSILSLFIITLCYEAKWSKRIVTVFIVYMCLFISEALVAMGIGLSGFSFFEKTQNGSYFLLFVSQIILWGVTLVIGKFKSVKVNMPVPKEFVVAAIMTPVTSVFLEILIFQQKNIDEKIVMASLICVILLNFIMIYLYDSLSKTFEERAQMEIVRRERTYYHNQSELLKKNEEDLRQFRHDIKNKILVIDQMLDKNEEERIHSYISQMTDKLNSTKMYSQSGNIVIDSILNYKLSKAEKQGVNVRANVVLPEKIEIEDDDIVIILGNLLDNAIEATEHLEKDKYIEVDFEYNKNCAFVTVKNSYDNVINIVNGTLKTRKSDEALHGIGLKSVKSTVEKYDGILNYEHNNQEFVVNVILYV